MERSQHEASNEIPAENKACLIKKILFYIFIYSGVINFVAIINN